MKRIKRDSEWLRVVARDEFVTAPDAVRLLKIADKLEESEPPSPPELTRKGIIAIRDLGMEDDEGRRVIHKAVMDELCDGALALLDEVEHFRQIEEDSQTVAQQLNLSDGKYTKWAADLSDDQVRGLFWLIGEFVVRSSIREFENIGGHTRRKAALELIINFRRNPMTLDKVLAYIRNSMRPEE